MTQHRPTSFAITITPDYFRTVGAAVISGRDFNDFDRASAPPSRWSMSGLHAQHWPGANPLGKRLRLFDFYGRNGDAWRTVVGVTSNIVQNNTGLGATDSFGGVVYVPYRQSPLLPS